MHHRPCVIIYRNILLPSGEKFIFNMAEALHSFTPLYAGIKRVEGVALPPERTFVVNEGGAQGLIGEVAFKYLRLAPGYVRGLRRMNPVLVHAQFGPDAIRALPLAESLRIPLLVHFRGYDATMKDERLAQLSRVTRAYLRRRELLKRKTRLFIAVSEFIKDKLLERGFPAEKILVHYTGVETNFFRPFAGLTREPLVLFVGRLVEKKGCAYLIRAMGGVQAVMPALRLVIIGEGPLRAELEKMAADTLTHYSFLGHQPPEAVRDWMQRALVLGLPSVTAESGDAEGMPNVAYEAQAVGLPVAGFAHAGIPEVVAHAETGLLAQERDWERLAESILALAQDKELWQRLSESGPPRVRAYFEIGARTKVLEEVYRRVINGSENFADLWPHIR